GLDALLPLNRLGNVATDLAWPQDVADIDGAQAGIEIGEEHQIGPRSLVLNVLEYIVRTEPSRPVEILLPVRKPCRYRKRVGFIADIENPHELGIPVVLPGTRLVGDDQIGTLA